MPENNDLVAGGTRSIVVLHENSVARENARDRLAEAGCEVPQRRWYSFASLEDGKTAWDAATATAGADVVVFAVSPADEFSSELKMWCEKWVHRRQDREGVMIGLVLPTFSGQVACLKEIYLRHLAHRAGMDYLSEIPRTLLQAMPDSPESCETRAVTVTAVLDGILHTQTPPPRVGV